MDGPDTTDRFVSIYWLARIYLLACTYLSTCLLARTGLRGRMGDIYWPAYARMGEGRRAKGEEKRLARAYRVHLGLLRHCCLTGERTFENVRTSTGTLRTCGLGKCARASPSCFLTFSPSCFLTIRQSSPDRGSVREKEKGEQRRKRRKEKGQRRKGRGREKRFTEWQRSRSAVQR